MLDYIYLGLYKFFGLLLKVLPKKMTIKLISALAWISYHVSKKHRYFIDQNLDLAFDGKLTEKEKRAIGISAFMNLIDTVFGIIHRDNLEKSEIIKNITFKNENIIKEYQKRDKAFILITGHYGNWELLSRAMTIKFGIDLAAVGRKLDSKAMEKKISANRKRFNIDIIYRNGAMKGCIRAIAQKKTVGILVDQHLSPSKSVDVKFFNHKATHTPIASILGRKYGIDMIPAFISTDDYENYTVTIYPPIKALKTENQERDLREMTQAQADIVEEVIRKEPKQWFWMHRRWKDYYQNIYKR